MSKGKVIQDKQDDAAATTPIDRLAIDPVASDDLVKTPEDNKTITDTEVQPRKPKDWEPPKTENENVAKPELG